MIVDDEPLNVDRLARLCGQLDGVVVVGAAVKAWSALAKVDALAPEALLQDVSVPGLDGLMVARSLAGRQHGPAVAFMTAHGRHAVTAIQVAAIDNLLKPVSFDRLRQSLDMIAGNPPIAAARAYLRQIWAPHGRDMVRLRVEALDLIEAERDYVRLHARGRAYLVRSTIRDLENQLDPTKFLRAHRSAIIPVDRVCGLGRDRRGGWSVLLSTGRSIRVGRSYEARVRAVTVGRPNARVGQVPENDEAAIGMCTRISAQSP